MQKKPFSNSYFGNKPHPKQLHPLFSTSPFGLVVGPLEQKRACGSNSLSLFGLNEGQGPQNYTDVLRFLIHLRHSDIDSSVSGTGIGIFFSYFQFYNKIL